MKYENTEALGKVNPTSGEASTENMHINQRFKLGESKDSFLKPQGSFQTSAEAEPHFLRSMWKGGH